MALHREKANNGGRAGQPLFLPKATLQSSCTGDKGWSHCDTGFHTSSSGSSVPSLGSGHLPVTPGSIPLHPAPGILDPNQSFHPAFVADLGERHKGSGDGWRVAPSYLRLWRDTVCLHSRPPGQSLHKHVLLSAYCGSSFQSHFRS